MAKLFRWDLLALAHHRRGIFNHENFYVSGESFVVEKWLPRFLATHAVTKPIFFDVGANAGDYSSLLARTFPQCRVQAFEPLPSTYATLQRTVAGKPSIQAWNVAMSDQEGTLELWANPGNPDATGHTTSYREVLTTQFSYRDVVSTRIPAQTLDGFCRAHDVERIHFLKIDTEGHEMAVLRGATALLEQKRIDAVQFEFNEMNIISRVFLRDFVQLLADYNFYRLLPGRLLPIHYGSHEEVFRFQNLLAVRKDLDKA